MTSSVREKIVNELHKRARKTFPRKRIKLLGIDDLWHSDLMFLQSYSKFNSNYKYLLIVIDGFSKYLWVRKLKTKLTKEVSEQMEDIFKKSKRVCRNLQTDFGGEYMGIKFQNLMKKYGINHYQSFTSIKASFAERQIRTLRERMGILFTLNGNFNWVKIIDKIVEDYNNTKHSTIKMKPVEVSKSNENFLLKNVYNIKEKLDKPKFKIGDFVRLSKFKKLFEKSTTRNWTTELFQIVQINKKYPITYKIKDINGNIILGQVYQEELQKTQFKDEYLIERILKKKGNLLLVSWLGFDKSHNSYINKNSLI